MENDIKIYMNYTKHISLLTVMLSFQSIHFLVQYNTAKH